jgi:DNA-binding NtrC family response regulator
VRDVEREYILAARERNNGNRTLTAEQLEIGPATLFRKLKRYGDGPWSVLLVAEAWTRVGEFIGSI